MSEVETIPELKQIIGAMLFAAREPVSMHQLRHVFEQTADQYGGVTKDFASVTDDMIVDAIKQLNDDLSNNAVGIHVREVANGYRLVNDPNCGLWLRVLLEKGKASRLSRPALETLAIIAYRQPVVRSEIESVRGVAVDQIIRNLLDMQLIRVVGRSDLPGRPWLFGTTQKFLEHFGIHSLNDLPGTDELRRLESEQMKRQNQQAQLAIDDAGGEETAQEDDEPAAAESSEAEESESDQEEHTDEEPEQPDQAQLGSDDEFVEEEAEDEERERSS